MQHEHGITGTEEHQISLHLSAKALLPSGGQACKAVHITILPQLAFMLASQVEVFGDLPLKHLSGCRNAASMTGLDRKCRNCTVLIMREVSQKYREAIELNGGPLVTEKRCSLCGCVKPADRFYRSNSMRHGLSSRCRECNAGKLQNHVFLGGAICAALSSSFPKPQILVIAIAVTLFSCRQANWHCANHHGISLAM